MPSNSQEYRPKRPTISPRARSLVVRAFLAIGCAGLAQVLVGCGSKPHTPESDAAGTNGEVHHFPIAIHQPAGSPRIPTGTFDEKGQPVTIACATCHATKPVNAESKLGTPLHMFHQGLTGNHGNLSCTSCHNPADGFASLRLADGKSVPYTQVMTLCAQCHGPQYRDYQHGSHGGMTGYWDTTKGGRVRNNCVDCHDPHAPKYPTVTPALGPNDRFLTGGSRE